MMCKICGYEAGENFETCPECGTLVCNPNVNRDKQNQYIFHLTPKGICLDHIKGTITKKEVVVPNSIDENPVVDLGPHLFENQKNIEYIVLPDTIKRIGSRCFLNMRELVNIEFSQNLHYLGIKAFEGCIKLEKIVLPQTISRIEEGAFLNCKNLKSISLPNTVELLGDKCFQGCKSLSQIDFPTTIGKIGKEIFNGCEALIDFRNICERSLIVEGMFLGCTGLKEIRFPLAVNVIGKSSFMGCSHLRKVVIPASVEVIEKFAFCNCVELEKVYILNGNCNISRNAFGQLINREKMVSECVWPVHKLDGSPDYRYNPKIKQKKMTEEVNIKNIHTEFYCEKDSKIWKAFRSVGLKVKEL